MTPERMAALVTRWVRLYTRGLPVPVADRRIDEIHADLHDHIAHDRARGTGVGGIALSCVARLARGLLADASWRRRVRPRKGSLVKILLALLVIALGVAAVVLGEADDSPGLQLIGVLLVGGAVALGVRTARRST